MSSQAESQQTPSTQKPLGHCASPWQGTPSTLPATGVRPVPQSDDDSVPRIPAQKPVWHPSGFRVDLFAGTVIGVL